jgi:hypothetical protein
LKAACTIVLVGASVAHASLCSAEERAEEQQNSGELAGVVGYGTSGSDANIFGAGLGLRLGYSGESRLYAGLSGLYSFGSHDEFEPDVHHHSESFRIECGYDVPLFPLILRPSLRVGFTHVTTPRDSGGGFVSPDVGVGATLLVRVKGPFLGLDVDTHYLTDPVNNGDNVYVITGIGVYAVGGYRF